MYITLYAGVLCKNIRMPKGLLSVLFWQTRKINVKYTQIAIFNKRYSENNSVINMFCLIVHVMIVNEWQKKWHS